MIIIVNCAFQYILTMQVTIHIVLFFLLLFLFQTRQANAQTFSDAQLTLLMKNSKYQEAAQLATARLKVLPATAKQERLYYMNMLGFAEFRMDNFDTAYRIGRQAIELTLHTSDSALISETWQLMAYAYNRTGRFDSAVYFSQKLLEYAIRHNDHKKHGNALTSISTILMQNGRYREALKYNFEANSLYRKLNDSSSLATSEYNIGLAYLNLNIPDSSLTYLFKSKNTYQCNPGGGMNAGILEAIAECYLLKGDEKLWKDYLLKSIAAAKNSNNKLSVAMSLSQLGQQALTTKDFLTAYTYLIQAREALAKQSYPALEMRLDSMLYVTTLSQHKYAEALKWHESFTSLQKKIFSAKQSESLNQLLVENETQKKNLLLLQKELELSRVKRSLSNLIIVAVFILLFAAVLLVYLIRVSRYRNVLFRKNKELDQQLQIARSRFELKYSQRQTDEEVEENNPDTIPDSDQNNKSVVLYSRLLDMIESGKMYLDPEFNVKTLQNELGTNKKYLYEAIAQFSGTNFRGLVNRYRINEVRLMMEAAVSKEKAISVNSLAFAAGFNSGTSFYRIFRQYTGLTPNEYIDQLKKERKRKISPID